MGPYTTSGVWETAQSWCGVPRKAGFGLVIGGALGVLIVGPGCDSVLLQEAEVSHMHSIRSSLRLCRASQYSNQRPDCSRKKPLDSPNTDTNHDTAMTTDAVLLYPTYWRAIGGESTCLWVSWASWSMGSAYLDSYLPSKVGPMCNPPSFSFSSILHPSGRLLRGGWLHG
jgi:hypothetical protein